MHQNISETETDIVIVKKDLRKIIYTIRGQQVMLDSDLAELYGVETSKSNQAVKRNPQRFPENFRLQITRAEYDVLISQFVIKKQMVTLVAENKSYLMSLLSKGMECRDDYGYRFASNIERISISWYTQDCKNQTNSLFLAVT